VPNVRSMNKLEGRSPSVVLSAADEGSRQAEHSRDAPPCTPSTISGRHAGTVGAVHATRSSAPHPHDTTIFVAKPAGRSDDSIKTDSATPACYTTALLGGRAVAHEPTRDCGHGRHGCSPLAMVRRPRSSSPRTAVQLRCGQCFHRRDAGTIESPDA
jgi:hypothetical protein